MRNGFEKEYIEDALQYYTTYIRKRDILISRVENIESEVLLQDHGYDKVNVQGSHKYKDHLEKMEELKEQLQEKISKYDYIIFKIEQCLDKIRLDKYYCVIDLLFFEKKSVEVVANILKLSVDRIIHERLRLIYIMKQ